MSGVEKMGICPYTDFLLRHLEDDVMYTYFHNFIMVLITEQKLGFGRQNLPLFANFAENLVNKLETIWSRRLK